MDLQSSNPNVAEKLSVHYMISMLKDCNRIQQMISFKLEKCKFIKKNYNTTLQNLVDYPINMVRNYARNMTNTKYIVLADMDHFFSKNFEQKMLHLANRFFVYHPKMVLVYRIFEVEEEYFNIKETKTGLVELMEEKHARLFHGYFIGHFIPKINAWMKAKESNDNTTSIQFYHRYHYNQWEPQFVSSQTIPFHDPSFRYPLHDNAVLRWEMCRAGYTFAIVHDVFMYHPGMKTKEESNYLDHARYALKNEKEKAKKKFWDKMDKKYPKTKGQCL
uniref:N-acetyllactosaminide beta-1,3-N-acetylglucosaminyltransferase n=1 Tax=Panagrolaimus sp. ES5 TaxID=591445 RepID=A0AC34FX62_9BILA